MGSFVGWSHQGLFYCVLMAQLFILALSGCICCFVLYQGCSPTFEGQLLTALNVLVKLLPSQSSRGGCLCGCMITQDKWKSVAFLESCGIWCFLPSVQLSKMKLLTMVPGRHLVPHIDIQLCLTCSNKVNEEVVRQLPATVYWDLQDQAVLGKSRFQRKVATVFPVHNSYSGVGKGAYCVLKLIFSMIAKNNVLRKERKDCSSTGSAEASEL